MNKKLRQILQYGTLKKATSSESGDTPGYVYEDLIQLTFNDIIIATQLANYLAETLDSTSYKTRTAKTISHLIRHASLQFRKSLRLRDDILRKIANCSDPLVAKIIGDSRVVLFDEDLVAKDDSGQEEMPKPTLSGMGASSGSKGFGNAPVSKENLGHKVLDIIDKVTTIPDERAQVLKMCLENSPTGSYEPVQAPMIKSVMKTSTSSSTMMNSSSFVLKGKKHKPGKAGGGWGSSGEEEDQDDQLEQQSLSEVSLTSPMKDLMIDSACEAIEDLNLPEIQAVKEYSSQSRMPTLKEIEDVFQNCQNIENSTVFEHFKVTLENNEEVFKTLRILLLIERFLRSNLGLDNYDNLIPVLKHLESDKNTSVANKAKKINLIIKRKNIS